MLSTYYKPRWARFFADVIAATEAGEPFSQEDFLAWEKDFEWNWWHVAGED